MNFYMTDKNLSKKELARLVYIIASCTDLNEVYWDTDEEDDRELLIKAIKSKFLPKSANGDS